MVSKIELPPYGVMPLGHDASEAAPKDWRPGRPFSAWLNENATMLHELLWPEFSQKNQAPMLELTRADIEILLQIRVDHLLDELPDSKLRHLDCQPHRSFFTAEDAPHKFGELHRSYDREMDEGQVLAALPRLFSRGWYNKGPNGIPFYFKSILQRPRPYQVALLLDPDTKFTHEAAKTALHPSMISGHCFVGMMGMAGVFERLLLDGTQLGGDSWDALRQYAVDIGDRRVMAGVHYPSDNLASWLLVLDLSIRTCHPAVAESVRNQLWKAISERSVVFKRIERALAEGATVYQPAWNELYLRAGIRAAGAAS